MVIFTIHVCDKIWKKENRDFIPGMTRQKVKRNLLFYMFLVRMFQHYPRHIEQSHSFKNMKCHISSDIRKKIKAEDRIGKNHIPGQTNRVLEKATSLRTAH